MQSSKILFLTSFTSSLLSLGTFPFISEVLVARPDLPRRGVISSVSDSVGVGVVVDALPPEIQKTSHEDVLGWKMLEENFFF